MQNWIGSGRVYLTFLCNLICPPKITAVYHFSSWLESFLHPIPSLWDRFFIFLYSKIHGTGDYFYGLPWGGLYLCSPCAWAKSGLSCPFFVMSNCSVSVGHLFINFFLCADLKTWHCVERGPSPFPFYTLHFLPARGTWVVVTRLIRLTLTGTPLWL